METGLEPGNCKLGTPELGDLTTDGSGSVSASTIHGVDIRKQNCLDSHCSRECPHQDHHGCKHNKKHLWSKQATWNDEEANVSKSGLRSFFAFTFKGHAETSQYFRFVIILMTNVAGQGNQADPVIPAT